MATTEQRRAQWQRWRARHPEKRKAQVRTYHLKKFYGLTQAEYDSLVEQQKGLCRICGDKPDRLAVDHCHTTKKIRGLLCGLCNRLLGNAKDNPKTLKAALKYLKETV